MIFWHKSQKLEPVLMNRVFKSLDYNAGHLIETEDWSVIIFPKNGYSIKNYLEFSDGFICCKGTFSYKGKFYEQALPILADDLRNQCLDLAGFWGAFVVFAKIHTQTVIIRDGAYLARLYCYSNKLVFSTSFAALLQNSKDRLELNKGSIVELLSTGLLSGSETLVNGIDFIGPTYTIDSCSYYLTCAKPIPEPSSFSSAVAQQVTEVKRLILNIYRGWDAYYTHQPFNLSITAGLDSRLLLAIIKTVTQNYNFFTYWRPVTSADMDFKISRMIADYEKKPLFFKEIRKIEDYNDEELESLFNINYNSCDGEIRPGSFWDEEFTSLNYRDKMGTIPHLRITAFEGEYYRNTERVPFVSNRSMRSWVRWDIIHRFAGHNLISPKAQMDLEDKIILNIQKLLGNCTYDLNSYKEYYRQIVVPSYRSLQNNIENRLGFYVAPFADVNLSANMPKISKYLGDSLRFEIAMLNMVSPELARLPNDYGFSFAKGETNMLKIGAKLWQLVPPMLKHRVFSIYRNHKDKYILDMQGRSKFVASLIEGIRLLQLPLKIEKISKRSVRGRMLLNLGYFIRKNEGFLR